VAELIQKLGYFRAAPSDQPAPGETDSHVAPVIRNRWFSGVGHDIRINRVNAALPKSADVLVEAKIGRFMISMVQRSNFNGHGELVQR